MSLGQYTPYNSRCHITARELRKLGFYLSEMIPDGAFVRRVAVGIAHEESIAEESACLRLRVLEPFRKPTRLALAG